MSAKGAGILRKYFPDISDNQLNKFIQLKDIYKYWNSQINVISRQDIDHLYERHVLHSLGIAALVRLRPGTTVLDIGTGGGFPGIPLAIFFSNCRFHLTDSIGKKIKVVKAVAQSLKLENVTAGKQRAEEVKGEFDFAVSRAVKPLAEMLPWVEKKIKPAGFNYLPNGMLCLKGGDLSKELKPLKREVRIFDLKEFFSEEFFEEKKIVHVKI